MEKCELEAGMLVQLNPKKVRPEFGGCIMVVTEPKSWGAQGYVQMTGSDGLLGGQAFYRAKWEDMELVGRAVWVAEKGGYMTFEEWFTEEYKPEQTNSFEMRIAKAAWQASREATIDECANIAETKIHGSAAAYHIRKLTDK